VHQTPPMFSSAGGDRMGGSEMLYTALFTQMPEYNRISTNYVLYILIVT